MSEVVRSLNAKNEVREKISVWLSSDTHVAVIHTIKELVGNSNDLICNGNGDTITIIRHSKDVITVLDNCKGLPVEGMGEKDIEGVGVIEIPNYKLLTAHLFAGTKYNNGLDGNTDYTVGTNGVFLTVLSRASEFCKYEVARPDGKVYTFAYAKGEEVEPLKVVGSSDKTYTKITYKLDDEVFVKDDIYFNIEELCEIAEQQSSLMKGGKIIVIDEETGTEYKYQFENGIYELFDKYNDGKSMIGEPLIISGKKVSKFNEKKKIDDNMLIEMVLQYSKEDEDYTQMEFLNGSNLIYHGTIYDGLVAGIRKAFDTFIKNNGLYNAKEKSIKVADCVMGLNYIINFKSLFPVYENQTKFGTDVKYYEEVMKEIIEHEFEVLTAENPDLMSKIANEILLNKRSREKSNDNRQKIRKELEGEVKNASTRPSKFVPCRSKDRTKRRIIIIEGDGALNAVRNARNKEYQAIYPMKGKPPNCLKKKIDEILANEQLRTLVKLFGGMVTYKGKAVKGFAKFDINKLQYAYLDILTDADEDGHHIKCLVICFVYMLMPDMIYNERVNIIEAPLYRIINKGKEYIAYSEMEKNEIVSKLKGEYQETRFKGIGGIGTPLMAKTTMSETDCRMKVVTMEDVKKSTMILEMFMDDESDDRKQYIAEHGYKYFDYSLYED